MLGLGDTGGREEGRERKKEKDQFFPLMESHTSSPIDSNLMKDVFFLILIFIQSGQEDWQSALAKG